MAYHRIIQDYQKGGLKLVDLETKATVLKAKWPLYFANRHKQWFYGELGLDHRIWQYNIEEKDVKLMCHKLSPSNCFAHIWAAWSKINFELPQNDVPMRTRSENENELNENKVQFGGITDFYRKFRSS